MANPATTCSVCGDENAVALIGGLCGTCHSYEKAANRKHNRERQASETDLATGGKETGNTYTAVVEFSGDELTALREKAEATGQSYWQLIQDAVLAYQPPATDHHHPWQINLTPAQQAALDAMGQTPQQLVDAALAERAKPSDERLWQAMLAIATSNPSLRLSDIGSKAMELLSGFRAMAECEAAQ